MSLSKVKIFPYFITRSSDRIQINLVVKKVSERVNKRLKNIYNNI